MSMNPKGNTIVTLTFPPFPLLQYFFFFSTCSVLELLQILCLTFLILRDHLHPPPWSLGKVSSAQSQSTYSAMGRM